MSQCCWVYFHDVVLRSIHHHSLKWNKTSNHSNGDKQATPPRAVPSWVPLSISTGWDVPEFLSHSLAMCSLSRGYWKPVRVDSWLIRQNGLWMAVVRRMGRWKTARSLSASDERNLTKMLLPVTNWNKTVVNLVKVTHVYVELSYV